jgi:hypothetical protein
MNQFIECVKRLTLIRNNNLHKFYEVAGIRFLTQNFTLTLLHEMPLFSHHTHSDWIVTWRLTDVRYWLEVLDFDRDGHTTL